MHWHSGEVFIWFNIFCSRITQCGVFVIKHLTSLRKEAGKKTHSAVVWMHIDAIIKSPLWLNCKMALSLWQLLGMIILWETFVFDKCSRRHYRLASAYIFRTQHWIMDDSHGRHHHSVFTCCQHSSWLFAEALKSFLLKVSKWDHTMEY